MQETTGGITIADSVEDRDVLDAVSLHDSWAFHIQGGSVYYDRDGVTWGAVPSSSVDCVITDPAYWTLDKWRNIGTTTRLGGNRDKDKQTGWFDTIDRDGLIELIDESCRVLKKDGHCWMMCDGQTLPYVLGYAHEGGCHDFKYIKPFPVLKKAGTGNYKQGMGYHGRCVHEYVVFMAREKHRRFNQHNWPDVFEELWCGDAESRSFTVDGKPYPTAKPVSLFKRWIELSTNPGDVVFDPFIGSGTAAVASVLTGRRFIGMDKSPDAIRTTLRRLSARQNHVQMNMFDDTEFGCENDVCGV